MGGIATLQSNAPGAAANGHAKVATHRNNAAPEIQTTLFTTTPLLNAPRHWMLDKMSGVHAPRPATGPHKLRECLPVSIILRQRLKYALTRREVIAIVKQKLIKVDGKIRTEENYPSGFMDVVSIDKTDENFRLLFDTKGRFVLQRVAAAEAKFKLLKVRAVYLGPKGVPHMTTHDGRTFRYPDPNIKVGDTVKFQIDTGKISEFIQNEIGNLVMITGGKNLGRVGVITKKERHDGSFEIVHVKDAVGQSFSTHAENVFIIGKKNKSLISLPKQKGIKKGILDAK